MRPAQGHIDGAAAVAGVHVREMVGDVGAVVAGQSLREKVGAEGPASAAGGVGGGVVSD